MLVRRRRVRHRRRRRCSSASGRDRRTFSGGTSTVSARRSSRGRAASPWCSCSSCCVAVGPPASSPPARSTPAPRERWSISSAAHRLDADGLVGPLTRIVLYASRDGLPPAGARDARRRRRREHDPRGAPGARAEAHACRREPIHWADPRDWSAVAMAPLLAGLAVAAASVALVLGGRDAIRTTPAGAPLRSSASTSGPQPAAHAARPPRMPGGGRATRARVERWRPVDAASALRRPSVAAAPPRARDRRRRRPGAGSRRPVRRPTGHRRTPVGACGAPALDRVRRGARASAPRRSRSTARLP